MMLTNAWGQLGQPNTGTQAFSNRLGAFQDAPPPQAPPQKGGGMHFNPWQIDPVTALLHEGSWRGPGGEWKDNSQANQFFDLRGGEHPLSSHQGLGLNWGAGQR